MNLVVVLGFTQSVDCKKAMAVVYQEVEGSSCEWVFIRFSADGSDKLTIGCTEQLSRQFIEMVAMAGCGEVFITQKDFAELAEKAAKAATFQSEEHDVDFSRISETIDVPVLS